MNGMTLEEKAVTINHKNFLNEKKGPEFYCKVTKALERLNERLSKSSQLMAGVNESLGLLS